MKNLTQIEGNLGQNPIHTVLSSGKEVTRFSVAVNKKWKKGGETKSVVDWFRVEAWGRLAQTTNRLQKGDTVFAQGELRTGSYVKDGVTHYTTTIIVINLRKVDNSIFSKSDVPEPAETEEEETDELTHEGVPF